MEGHFLNINRLAKLGDVSRSYAFSNITSLIYSLFERFAENIKLSGLLVSAIFGAIAVVAAAAAAIVTAPVTAVVLGAVAVGAAVAGTVTEAYTYATAFVDTVTGHETEEEVFLDNVLSLGAATFVLVTTAAAVVGTGGGGGAVVVPGVGTMSLEGVLVISLEGVVAGALEVIVEGTLAGTIALAASMGSNGGNEGDSNSKIDEIIDNIPNKYKQNGQCDSFAERLTEQLKKKGIDYEIVRVDSKYGIYSDKAGESIGVNYHYGVKVGDTIYDNMTPNGMSFSSWLDDLGLTSQPKEYIDWSIVDKILNH